jgi:hypothetical protein
MAVWAQLNMLQMAATRLAVTQRRLPTRGTSAIGGEDLTGTTQKSRRCGLMGKLVEYLVEFGSGAVDRVLLAESKQTVDFHRVRYLREWFRTCRRYRKQYKLIANSN